ncbi:unnamed protein product [Staurois parvus]|uniref:Uncharacterized protein n=1 Tax=Staurois parvus TaxID=386267 RepID=A0ABN9GZ79_9NEOB|nr:unnamed protein product [Staurois parvus]
MEVSGGIGRKGWRTLSGGQWRDWQRGMEDTGGPWRDLQRGMEASGGIGREGWRTLSGGQWRDWQRGVADTERSANEEGVTIVKAR